MKKTFCIEERIKELKNKCYTPFGDDCDKGLNSRKAK